MTEFAMFNVPDEVAWEMSLLDQPELEESDFGNEDRNEEECNE